MICPRCKNKLRPGALFCVRCGARFKPGEVPRTGQERVISAPAATVDSAPKSPGTIPASGSAPVVAAVAASPAPRQDLSAAQTAPQQPSAAPTAPAAPRQQPYAAPAAPVQQPYAAPAAPVQQPYAAPAAPVQQPYAAPAAPRQQPYAAAAAPRQPAAPVNRARQQAPVNNTPKTASSGGSSKKRKILLAILIPTACAMIAFIVLLIAVAIPAYRYYSAVKLKEAGKYEEAISAFEALGYDSSDSNLQDSLYKEALELYEAGRYDEAIPKLEKLDGYRDSDLLLLDCRYYAAVDLYDSGDYEGARDAFNALDGYKDSAGLADLCGKEIRFEEAMELYNAGAYDRAQRAFEALGDYGDSATMAKKCSTAAWRYLSVGDTVLFGSYEQDNNPSNGKEEIEWLILDKRSDCMLVVSRYALDCQVFYPSMSNITWSSSHARTWLNNSFINSAFTAEERNLIQTTSVTADRNPYFNTNPGSSTSDKLFLLSITEVGWYFNSDSDMVCKGTQYCYAQGAYIGTNNNCWWWLRTPGDRNASAATVSSRGGINYNGNDVDAIAGGIRPAMWISIG